MNPERPDLPSKVRALPHEPGVYLYKDRFGRVIYVGKAIDLRKRVAHYFQKARASRSDRKLRALLENIWDLETYVVKSEAEALILESKLIKEYRPRYNVSFRDDKRFLLVKINLKETFPKFQLARLRQNDGCRYFGPFPQSGPLRRTLNLIRKKFLLRSCAPAVPGELDFKHCMEPNIKACTAPCVGRVSREQYMEQVLAACEFLEGHSRAMAADLEAEMKKAAVNLDFEKAARLRNLLEDIRLTTKPAKRFLREFETTVRPEDDLRDLQEALRLPSPPERIECFDISNISTTHKVASMVCFRNGRADKAHYRRYRIRTVEGQDDFASMAEAVRRRYQRVLTENLPKPDLIVVDGGRGQLGAALAELEALGLGGLRVIGLAKEREEIYRPDEKLPLQLGLDRGALRLLQRIRDEAHRFANAYHQILLKQRVKESALDECPGVSERRKKLLLAHFGSVEKLRRASADEIGAVPGIGKKLGQTLAAFLQN